jgi:hypothetical protein
MPRYRDIAYDVQTSFNQEFGDNSITLYQALWWVSVVGNDLLKRHQDNEYNRTGWASGQFLTQFPNVKVTSLPVTIGNVTQNRKHAVLPRAILDFDFDRGIDYISYTTDENSKVLPPFTSVLFSRTTVGRAQRLYGVSFEEPSSENPYFYVVKNIVYFLGIEDTIVDSVEMGLRTSIDPRYANDPDEDFFFPDSLAKQLKYDVLNLGMFLKSIPEDKVNDGNDAVMTKPQKQVAQNEQ